MAKVGDIIEDLANGDRAKVKSIGTEAYGPDSVEAVYQAGLCAGATGIWLPDEIKVVIEA